MGNTLCDCGNCQSATESLGNNEDINYLVSRWLNNLDKLKRAQVMTHTKTGLTVTRAVTSNMMTNAEVDVIRNEAGASEDVRLIMNPPFSQVCRITDKLYLTGIAGLTMENFGSLHLSLIVNTTYEMPLLERPNIASVRIPVDDDCEDDLHYYLSEVADLIHQATLERIRTVVHCVAGASRSATVVIGYLIKHHNLSLKESFCYVHAARECARPNMGFFEQLIQFEKQIRGDNSTKMIERIVNGVKVRIPDFYENEFPRLFQAEVNKQLRIKTNSLTGGGNSGGGVRQEKSVNTHTTRITNVPHAMPQKGKVYLKDIQDEIYKIRIRSCYGRSKSVSKRSVIRRVDNNI